MKKETLQKYIESYTGDNLAADLARLIKQVDTVLQERTSIDRQWRTFEDEKYAKIKELELLERDLQASCPHLESSFYGDPSGNNDSYYQCDLCRRVL